jgi:integrase
VVGVLSPRTEKDYRQVVERWTRDGQPDPVTWVSERSSEATRRNARAGLVWHFRVTLGRTLDIPWVRPMHQPVPSAFSVEELATIREEALDVHRRCRPVIDLLYSTGARLQEACGISLEDVKDTHIILRDTKRRPGGLQVDRAVPLGPVSRAAVIELSQLRLPSSVAAKAFQVILGRRSWLPIPQNGTDQADLRRMPDAQNELTRPGVRRPPSQGSGASTHRIGPASRGPVLEGFLPPRD